MRLLLLLGSLWAVASGQAPAEVCRKWGGGEGVFSLGHCLPIYAHCDAYERLTIETCEHFPTKVIYGSECVPRHHTECPGILEYRHNHPSCYHRGDFVFGLAPCESRYAVCFSDYLFLTSCPKGEVFHHDSATCVPAHTLGCHKGWQVPRQLDDELCWGQGEGSLHHLGPCLPNYVQCHNGQAHTKACPHGEIFTNGKFCHTALSGECFDYGAVGHPQPKHGDHQPGLFEEKVLALAELLGFCSDHNSGLFIPQGEHCSEAGVFCMHGKASVVRCAHGHVVHPYEGTCVAFSHSVCPADGGGARPGLLLDYLAQQRCEREALDGKLLLRACKPYYLHCHSHHGHRVSSCHGDDLFFAHLGECHAREGSLCQGSDKDYHHQHIDQGHGHGTFGPFNPQPLPCDSLQDGLLPKESCSSHYFVCADHRTLAATCPSDFAFDGSQGFCVPRLSSPACPRLGSIRSGEIHHLPPHYEQSGAHHAVPVEQYPKVPSLRQVHAGNGHTDQYHREPHLAIQPAQQVRPSHGHLANYRPQERRHNPYQPKQVFRPAAPHPLYRPSPAKVIDLSKKPLYASNVHRNPDYVPLPDQHFQHQAACSEGFSYADPREPGAYRLCVNGRLLTRLCPPRQHWRKALGHCDVFEEPHHGDHHQGGHGQHYETGGGGVCSGVAYAAGPVCSTFKQCDHGHWAVRRCPAGTGWDQRVLTCDFLRNKPCGY